MSGTLRKECQDDELELFGAKSPRTRETASAWAIEKTTTAMTKSVSAAAVPHSMEERRVMRVVYIVKHILRYSAD
jgi:hypothetical protein